MLSVVRSEAGRCEHYFSIMMYAQMGFRIVQSSQFLPFLYEWSRSTDCGTSFQLQLPGGDGPVQFAYVLYRGM